MDGLFIVYIRLGGKELILRIFPKFITILIIPQNPTIDHIIAGFILTLDIKFIVLVKLHDKLVYASFFDRLTSFLLND